MGSKYRTAAVIALLAAVLAPFGSFGGALVLSFFLPSTSHNPHAAMEFWGKGLLVGVFACGVLLFLALMLYLCARTLGLAERNQQRWDSSAPEHKQAHPPDGSDAATPSEGEGREAE